MSKGLNHLEILKNLVELYGHFSFDFTVIENELKALEIIKKYKDVISLDKEYNEEFYTQEEIEKEGGQKYYFEDGSDGYKKHEITKEEYDLLKEVLL